MRSVRIVDGGANTPLATAVARLLDAEPVKAIVGRFPDLEASVQLLDSVVGTDVYVIQPTGPPPDAHLMELLLLADAARRGNAARVTAVVPYVGYARQDHDGGRPIGASLVAHLMESAGIDQVIAVDLHSRAVETSSRIPVIHLSAVPALAERLREFIPESSVVVAPDLGAVKLADRYAQILDLPVAFVRKERVSGSAVAVRGVVGPVAGRIPIIVDDMITTGGTIVAAADACRDAGGAGDLYLAASHALLVGDATKRLERLSVRSFVTTDSVICPSEPGYLSRVSIAGLLADEMCQT